MGTIARIVELVFELALFINALLFIPQIIRIIKEKTARGISLLTFVGFLLIQLVIILHGFINSDYILAGGYLLSAFTCGIVVLLILVYKNSIQISTEEILDQLPGHVYWKNKDGVLLWCNKKNLEDFGVKSLTDFVGKTDYDLFSKEEAEHLREDDEKVMRSGELMVFEEEYTAPNGTKILYLSHKAPLMDRYNQIAGTIGISIDITNSKQEALDKLRVLENIVAIMPGHVYWIDKEGVYLGCNDNKAKSIGFNSRYEIIGKSNKEICGFFIPETINHINKKVMEAGKTVITEEPALLGDGTEATFLSTKAPLYDNNHKITGMAVVSIDITDHKKAESLQRETELQKIKIHEHEKFAILAEQVANDIRSPLASLSMTMDSCSNVCKEVRVIIEDAITNINATANHLLGGYNKETKNPQQILVALALSEILSKHKSKYTNLPLKFNFSIEPNSGFAFIKIDPLSFDCIISNLINNSIKILENKKCTFSLKLSAVGEHVDIIVQIHSCIIDAKNNLTQINNLLQENNGRISIESDSNETKITLTFPRTESPDWIARKIVLHKGDTVIILDSDVTVHNAWNTRFENYKNFVHLKYFKSGEKAIEFINTILDKNKIFLISDFELINQELNSLQERSVLTVNNVDSSVKNKAEVLPKMLISDIPIEIEEKEKRAPKIKKVDLIVIDDNQLFTDSLAAFFQIRSLKVDTYHNPKRFLENLAQYSNDTKICLDYDFKHQVNGIELAKQLKEAGYTKLYLLSGKSFEKIDVPEYLTIISKGNIDAIDKLAR